MKLAQKLGLIYYKTNLQVLSMLSPKKAARHAFRLFSTPMKRNGVEPDAIFTNGEMLSFRAGDNLITGHRWNHPARKKVLIIHGFESSSYNFHQYIKELIGKNCEVIAFDAPAHGRSGGKRILLPDYINTIVSILQKYGPIDHFIAHSFGGLALMHALEDIPHDSSWKVVLVAPATETTSAVDRFFRMFSLSRSVRKHFDELIIKKGGEASSHYSIRRAAKKISASILWIHDDTDKVTPIADALKVKNDKHTNLQFVTTTGLGHRRIYKDEGVIKSVVNFLSEG
jgi:pimeloyl-ACP methyl ester carboxylesterase